METVDVEEARQLVAKNEVEVIDLRDDEAWVGGHLPGAHHAGEDLDATLEKIDDDRKLLIVCADGQKSAEVAEKLSNDDREAIALEGGFDAWDEEGLRTQPSQDYEPGPDPIEEEDDAKAAEAAEGTIEDQKRKEEVEDEEPDVTAQDEESGGDDEKSAAEDTEDVKFDDADDSEDEKSQ
jgi:rhodanese-related sulfurtransferase